jgi:hypothetical protein
VDGWVVPHKPPKIFGGGRQMHIPVLVGSNANEATVLVHGGPSTLTEYRQYLPADGGTFANEEFRRYPAASDAECPRLPVQLLL